MLPFQRNRLSLFTKFVLFNDTFYLVSNYLPFLLLLHYSPKLLKCGAKSLGKILSRQILEAWPLQLSCKCLESSDPSASPTAPELG